MNAKSNRIRRKKRANRSFQVESLEQRQLLTADVLTQDVGEPSDLIAAGGIVSGTVWQDLDGDGDRGANEVGMPGVTVYADANENGRFDRGETSVITQKDLPNTRIDESGRYEMFLFAGNHTIRQVVPEDHTQTFPASFVIDPIDPIEVDPDTGFEVVPPAIFKEATPGDVFEIEAGVIFHPTCVRPLELDVVPVGLDGELEIEGVDIANRSGILLNGCGGDLSMFELEIIEHDEGVPYQIGFFDIVGGDLVATLPVISAPGEVDGGHRVTVEFGGDVGGLDFGNQPTTPTTGSIAGRKWLDQNGNGEFDEDESGLGGVQVYIDSNGNGEYDFRELTTTTRFDDPESKADESGTYSFGRLRPGTYTVREVVPTGYVQTSPTISGDVISSETGKFEGKGGRASDFDIVDVAYNDTGEGISTDITLSVQWPDGCGLIEGDATYSVIGDTILVNVDGHSNEGPCVQVVSQTPVTVTIPDLEPGEYSVVGTFEEAGVAAFGVVGEIEIGKSGSHTVTVTAGEIAGGMDFGNQRVGPLESVSGVVWNDVNGDRSRQKDEVLMGGVTVYADLNWNSVLDENEPFVLSSADDAQLGTYTLELGPGNFSIRQVVPEGFRETFPDIVFGPIEPFGGVDYLLPFFPYHSVTLNAGDQHQGINFGNQSTEAGSISGVKWHDENGNAIRDAGEGVLAGVTVYADGNFNGLLDDGEQFAVTGEDGTYELKVRPGSYNVLEVVPEGYRQTYPQAAWFDEPLIWDHIDDEPFGDPIFIDPIIGRPWSPTHYVNVQPGSEVTEINFGNQKLQSGSISGTKWLDSNGNGTRDEGEVGLAGVTIYLDSNFNSQLDEGERFTVTLADDAATEADETGRYRFDDVAPLQFYWINEVVPEGYEQTFPAQWIGPWEPPFTIDPIDPELPPEIDPEIDPEIGIPNPDIFDRFPFFPSTHNVYVDSGADVTNIDFGNRKLPERAFAEGTAWSDANGNGQQDEGERGLAGIRIFVDTNANGTRDFNENFVFTQRDDPTTETDEAGQYKFDIVSGEVAIIPEVRDLEISFPREGAYKVNAMPGETVSGIDFGFLKPETSAKIAADIWFDANTNGIRERGEEQHSGRVFIDANNNGMLDPDEQVEFASPNAEFDVVPGTYTVRPILERGIISTFPSGQFEVHGSEMYEFGAPGSAIVEASVEEVAFSSTSPDDSGQRSTNITINTVWGASEVAIVGDYSIEGNQIIIELFGKANGVDADVLVDYETTINVSDFDPQEFGDVEIHVTIYDEGQGAEAGEPSGIGVVAHALFQGTNAHTVSVGDGDTASVSFGVIAVPINVDPTEPVVDSRMGEDPHESLHDDSATHIEFHDDHATLNSYVDADDDIDVFQFVGNGHVVVGEGVGDSDYVEFELLDAEGNAVAVATTGEEFAAKTEDGQTYYLRVSGNQGRYGLNLVQQAAVAPEVETPVLEGDTDNDGDVDFKDFLVIAANFGEEVDAAFAEGDFDVNGSVDFADFLALSVNYGKTV